MVRRGSPRDAAEVERLDVSELVGQKAAVLHVNLQKTKKKCRVLEIKERQEEEEPPGFSCRCSTLFLALLLSREKTAVQGTVKLFTETISRWRAQE